MSEESDRDRPGGPTRLKSLAGIAGVAVLVFSWLNHRRKQPRSAAAQS
ncbi:hypothetical protein ACFU98_39425 [Streptomyces sp. NPDC057575]